MSGSDDDLWDQGYALNLWPQRRLVETKARDPSVTNHEVPRGLGGSGGRDLPRSVGLDQFLAWLFNEQIFVSPKPINIELKLTWAEDLFVIETEKQVGERGSSIVWTKNICFPLEISPRRHQLITLASVCVFVLWLPGGTILSLGHTRGYVSYANRDLFAESLLALFLQAFPWLSLNLSWTSRREVPTKPGQKTRTFFRWSSWIIKRIFSADSHTSADSLL